MSSKYFLSSYTIRVEKKPDQDKRGVSNKSPYLILDKFSNGDDLFEIFKNYLESLKKQSCKDDVEKVVIRVSDLYVNPETRIIDGIIKCGAYGIESELIDTETNRIVHNRKLNHAETLPFYFFISIPKNKNEGILILERIGIYGIRTRFSDDFKKHFSLLYPKLLASINHLVPDQIVQQILRKGITKKIRFIKYEIPTDRFEGFDGGHKEIPGNFEISISAKNIPILERINSLFDGSRTVKNLFEIKDFGIEYDTIKIEVKMPGGSRKIVNLGNWQKVRNYIDITEKVSKEKNGQPSLESLRFLTLELHKDLSQLMYKD